MLFSLLKHYLDRYISDTALKVFRSLYCFSTSICHGVENYFPRLWGTGISNAIFNHVLIGFSVSETSGGNVKVPFLFLMIYWYITYCYNCHNY